MDDKQLTYRLVKETDVAAAVELMRQSHLAIGGISRPALHRAICRAALSDEHVYVAVAANGKDQVVAYLLAITDWRAFWATFLRRHPILSFRMVIRRGWRRIWGRRKPGFNELTEEQQKEVKLILSREVSGRSWYDSAPDIAKAVLLHVDSQYRRRGIAVALYEYLFGLMAADGVRRCDATVDVINTRAHPLHVRMGYRLEPFGSSLFATQDLERWKDNGGPAGTRSLE